MMPKHTSLAASLCLLVGCSGSDDPGGSGDQGGAGLAAPDPAEGVQLRMATSVEPGEATYCQYFALPEDRRVDVRRFEHEFTKGSHHLILVQVDPTDTPPQGMVPCTGQGVRAEDNASGILYGGTSPTGVSELPEGVAVEFEAGSTLMMQSHYVNTTEGTLSADVRVNLWFIDPSEVHERASAFFFFDPFIFVPAGGEGSTTMRCPLPAGTRILSAVSHMHKRGIDFEAALLHDGDPSAPLYRSTQWADPVTARFFDDPREIEEDSRIEFTCRYRNDRDVDVAVGFSAETDEMCIFAGLYYPAQDARVNSCADGEFVASGTARCADVLGCSQRCGADIVCASGCAMNVCPASSPALTTTLLCVQNLCSADPQPANCAIEKCGSALLACNDAGC